MYLNGGTSLDFWRFHRNTNESRVTPMTNHYLIISEDSGKALAVHHHDHVVIHGVNGDSNQHWIIHDDGHVENVAHRGKFLEVEGGHHDNGAKVRISHWHGGHHQQFKYEPDRSIRVRHSNKVLDVEGAQHHDHTPIIQWHHHGGSNQRFVVIPVHEYEHHRHHHSQYPHHHYFGGW